MSAPLRPLLINEADDNWFGLLVSLRAVVGQTRRAVTIRWKIWSETRRGVHPLGGVGASCSLSQPRRQTMEQDHERAIEKPAKPVRVPWNKGKLVGAKPPLRPSHVWSAKADGGVLDASEAGRTQVNPSRGDNNTSWDQ
jgi:hypothetical protein